LSKPKGSVIRFSLMLAGFAFVCLFLAFQAVGKGAMGGPETIGSQSSASQPATIQSNNSQTALEAA
jgi:hypothetical protein